MARSAVAAFLAVALLGAGGLVLAGISDQRSTAFSLEVPNAGPVITLSHGQRACQGPVVAQAAFAGLELWRAAVPPPGTTLRISVVATGGAVLSSGSLRVLSGAPASPSVRLSHTVSAGTSLSLCFVNAGPAPVALLGAPPDPGSGVLERGGHDLASAAAVVLLRPHSSSLLSLLGTVFRRAALFRPTWVGAWTFWLLLAALGAAFGLAALALGLAARDPEP